MPASGGHHHAHAQIAGRGDTQRALRLFLGGARVLHELLGLLDHADTAAYIRKFDELVPQHTTAEALFAAMKQAFPNLTGDIVLQFSTKAAYPSGT